MKLNNIAIALATAILSLTGCVNEELTPSNGVIDGLPTSLNLTFTTEEVTTKAPTAHDDYDFATAEEIRINTLAVAVFKVNTNNSVGGLLGFKYFSAANAGELEAVEDAIHGVPGYKVSGIPAETGKVKILAIANSGISEADLKAANTYTSFTALAESYTNGTAPAYGFEAGNLVKFREMEATLSTASNATPVHIELVQLAARVDVGINIINAVADGKWTFTMNSYVASGINASSNTFLGDDISSVTNTKISNPLVKTPSTTQSLTINSTDNGAMKPAYAFSFYTYEKLTKDSPIHIDISGTLQDEGQPEEPKLFRIVLDPVKVDGDPKKQTNGVVHGNVYTVVGSIDVTLKTINFAYAVIPWQDVHLTEVNIKPIYYLLVKDLYMSMPNMEEITTTFESSSEVEIINLKTFVVGEGEPVEDASPKATVTPSASNNGTITIGGAVPTNFVPRKITFTVRNKNGLTQDVVVDQYPPLFIEAGLGDWTKTVSSGQTNWNMYKFTSLVANYSLFPYPDDFKENPTIRGNEHKHDQGTSESRGRGYTDFIRANARMGYPLLTTEGYTLDTEENNMLISPSFILASQFGTSNTTSTYAAGQRNGNTVSQFSIYNRETGTRLRTSTTQPSCKDYVEVQNGVTYSDWRLPTRAELYMIDILQNVQSSAVKAILEGTRYWSADQDGGSVYFMDARLGGSTTTTTGAYRCVHDIK